MRKKPLISAERTTFVRFVVFGLAFSGAFGFPAPLETTSNNAPSERGTMDVAGLKTSIKHALEQTSDVGDKGSNSTTVNIELTKRRAKCDAQCENCSDGQCDCPGGCQGQKPANDSAQIPPVKRIERETENVESTIRPKAPASDEDDEEDEDEVGGPEKKDKTQESDSDEISGGYEAMLSRERQLYVRSVSELAGNEDRKKVIFPPAIWRHRRESAKLEPGSLNDSYSGSLQTEKGVEDSAKAKRGSEQATINAASSTETKAGTERNDSPGSNSTVKSEQINEQSSTLGSVDHQDIIKRAISEADGWERFIENEVSVLVSRKEVEPAYKDWDYLYPLMNQVRLTREAAKAEKAEDSSVKNDTSVDVKREASDSKAVTSDDTSPSKGVAGEHDVTQKEEPAEASTTVQGNSQTVTDTAVTSSSSVRAKRKSGEASTGKETEEKPTTSATEKEASIQDALETETHTSPASGSTRIKRDSDKSSSDEETEGISSTSATEKFDVSKTPIHTGAASGVSRARRDSEITSTEKETDAKSVMSIQDGLETKTKTPAASETARAKRDNMKSSSGESTEEMPYISTTENSLASEMQTHTTAISGSARARRDTEKTFSGRESQVKPSNSSTKKAASVQDGPKNEANTATASSSTRAKRDSEETEGLPGTANTEMADVSEIQTNASRSPRVKRSLEKKSAGHEADKKSTISTTGKLGEVYVELDDASEDTFPEQANPKNSALAEVIREYGSPRVRRGSKGGKEEVGNNGILSTEKLNAESSNAAASVSEGVTPKAGEPAEAAKQVRAVPSGEQSSNTEEPTPKADKPAEAAKQARELPSGEQSTQMNKLEETSRVEEPAKAAKHERELPSGEQSTQPSSSEKATPKADEPAKVAKQERELPSEEQSTQSSSSEKATPEADEPAKAAKQERELPSGEQSTQSSNLEGPTPKADEPAKAAKQERELPSGEQSTQMTSSEKATPKADEPAKAAKEARESPTGEQSTEANKPEQANQDSNPAKTVKQARESPNVEQSTQSKIPEKPTSKDVSKAPIKEALEEKDNETQNEASSREEERKNAPTVAEPKGEEAKKHLKSGLESSWGSDSEESDTWQQERRLGDNRRAPSDDPSKSNVDNLDIKYLGGNDLPISSENSNPEEAARTSASSLSGQTGSTVQIELKAKSATTRKIASVAILIASLASAALKL